MALILCDVTECRHNDQRQCLLDQIAIVPGFWAVIPETLQGTSRVADEPWLYGYASEFDAYVDYAHTHPESLSAGALCQSYAP